MQWMIVMPLEIVAAAITIQYWNYPVSPAAWVSIFLVIIIGINMVGVQGYGEAECVKHPLYPHQSTYRYRFFFSLIKIIAVVGFIVLGVILDSGGGLNGEYIGGRNYRDPGVRKPPPSSRCGS